jgi:MarR family transcriptional regulator, organic hydroperoxide resistance regulator
MTVVSSRKTELATDAWIAMLEFFFAKGRPRMLELWREFDLMPPQQLILGLLDEPRPMGELARQMHCDNSNITGLIDRLSERGLVERRAVEGDRRVKLVALTDEGRAIRDELVRRRSEPPPEIEALSDDDLRQLQRIFTGALNADG